MAAMLLILVLTCRFWGMLGYLANTLIFILVGVVIAQKAFSGVEDIDWFFMVALYIGIMVIRYVNLMYVTKQFLYCNQHLML